MHGTYKTTAQLVGIQAHESVVGVSTHCDLFHQKVLMYSNLLSERRRLLAPTQ
jgi:hypothetical protein